MKIILDAMSGDNAPLQILRGAVLARRANRKCAIVLVGDEARLREVAAQDGIDLSPFSIVHAEDVVHMEDSAMCVTHEKRKSSMAVGLSLLAKGEGDAFVSAGNTGALLVGASLLVRRIRGISRPGIATVLPLKQPMLLLDSGANLVVAEENIEDFAVMGSVYMKKLYGIESPRVGQVNNGSEYNKGLPLQVASYQRLSESEHVHFVGNIEGRDIPFGACDVLVTDGFTGNVILKLTEGMGKFMLESLRNLLGGNALTRLFTACFMKAQINKMKKALSASEHGGALILGVKKPVIKAHGGSDAVAIKNAISQAIKFADNGVNQEIERTIAAIREKRRADEIGVD